MCSVSGVHVRECFWTVTFYEHALAESDAMLCMRMSRLLNSNHVVCAIREIIRTLFRPDTRLIDMYCSLGVLLYLLCAVLFATTACEVGEWCCVYRTLLIWTSYVGMCTCNYTYRILYSYAVYVHATSTTDMNGSIIIISMRVRVETKWTSLWPIVPRS